MYIIYVCVCVIQKVCCDFFVHFYFSKIINSSKNFLFFFLIPFSIVLVFI